jgi:ketosteroid isomerase-like protein
MGSGGRRPADAQERPRTQLAPDQAEANRKTIRDAFEAWKDGVGAITDVFAPEMRWRVEGHSLMSREYETKQQFIDELLAPFLARFSPEEPFRPVGVRSVYAEGDAVIVLWDGHGIANDGQPYGGGVAWFLKLRDGKVVEGAGFFDTLSFNDLWTRVPPSA